jgi:hypothetical protein
MANPTIIEKIQARYNAKRVEASLPVVDFTGYTMALPEAYSGPQSTSNTLIYCVPLAASNNLGRLKIFLNRLNLSAAVGVVVTRGTFTRVFQLLPQLSNELGVTLITDDIIDDDLPVGASFTLGATSGNRLFFGTTTVTLE